MTRLTVRLVSLCLMFKLIFGRTNPRFDMRDKDGIIFDPIAPRAGERLVARCTLVGLTDTDKRSVNFIDNSFSLKCFSFDLGQLGITSFKR